MSAVSSTVYHKSIVRKCKGGCFFCVICDYCHARDVAGPDSEQTEPDVVKPIDQVKLGKFLQNAARTMICLLDEARLASGGGGSGDAGGRQHERRQRRSDICLSEAFSELDYSTLSFLSGRHITHCHISPSQSHMMLTAFSDSDRSSKVSGQHVQGHGRNYQNAVYMSSFLRVLPSVCKHLMFDCKFLCW